MLSQLAHSNDFSNFYVIAYGDGENMDCSLTQPKADVIGSDKVPLKFVGTKNHDACDVNIQRKDFENKFEFCFLSGVKYVGQSGARQTQCYVGYNKGMWSFTAFFHASGQNSQDRKSVTCSFICKNR